MHGVRKIKTTEDKEREQKAESKAKIVQYKTLLGTMQKMRKESNYTEEALKVVGKILDYNPDFYVAWNYRREILSTLEKTLSSELYAAQLKVELDVTQKGIAGNPKSYWVWFHRRWVTSHVPSMDWSRELLLCEKLLDMDSRNFHCWNYRRFVSKCAGKVFADDLQFTKKKIDQNFSNYSAWHQRSFLLPLVYTTPHELLDALVKELAYVRAAFFTEPADQSGWVYHRWLMGKILEQIEIVSKLPAQPGTTLLEPATFIQSEIDECLQLRDLEPGSKWVVLTCVFLNQLLFKYLPPSAEQSAKLVEDLALLKCVDQTHLEYYNFLSNSDIK